jgi:hypothetical protein
MSENVGASTSRNPKGLHGLYRESFTFTLNYTYTIKSQLFLLFYILAKINFGLNGEGNIWIEER